MTGLWSRSSVRYGGSAFIFHQWDDKNLPCRDRWHTISPCCEQGVDKLLKHDRNERPGCHGLVQKPAQAVQKGQLLTRPTPARQDAPFHRQGRSKRRGEAYPLRYVEPLSAARTPLADFVNSLLGCRFDG